MYLGASQHFRVENHACKSRDDMFHVAINKHAACIYVRF